MDNKLGIYDRNLLKDIEYKLTSMKYSLLDGNFTFNEDTIFSISYLEKLHIFLFRDLYPLSQCKIREDVSKETIDRLNETMEKMRFVGEMSTSKLADLIYDIWKEQIFFDGNTRTIKAFLKVYKEGYNLNLNNDFTSSFTKDKDFFIDEIIDEITENATATFKK